MISNYLIIVLLLTNGNKMKNDIFDSISILTDRNAIMDIIAKNIGRKIKILRGKYNLSGSHLAKIIGVSQQQLSKYENGHCDISSSKIMIIAIYFNVDANYFFTK